MKKKVNRKNCWWYSFKMKWLVPNWKRAAGPAFMIYRLKNWWLFNMDAGNCCGLLNKVIEWKDCTLMKWLTPQLKNARKFLNFCSEENDTKLLWYKANFFRCRTRDDNQYYFNGWANWLGKVTVTRSQWLNAKGEVENLFLWGIANSLLKSDDKPVEMPVEKTVTIFSGWILTNKQLELAKEEILKQKEFDWDMLRISEGKLAKELGMTDKIEAFNWSQSLKDAVLKKHWPDAKAWWELEQKDRDEFNRIICNMKAEEAKELVEKHVACV